MDFLLDDDTPVVEQKPFQEKDNPTKKGPATLLGLNSRSDSSSSEEVNADACSSSDSSSSSAMEAQKKAAAVAATAAQSDMSNSYHEIFDAQMPPEAAKAVLERSSRTGKEEEEQEKEEERCVSGNLLPCDTTAQDTTDYLTAKLVQDSLNWQKEHGASAGGGAGPGGSSVPASPSRKGTTVSSAAARRTDARISVLLDPSVLADLEHDARHLATSVDCLVENLSGILHSISALTVETVEAYRDGVCKTCDEVDGNIKSMYQLMAKVEELNKSMAPAYKLADQIKETKRLLDMLEATSTNPKFKPLQ